MASRPLSCKTQRRTRLARVCGRDPPRGVARGRTGFCVSGTRPRRSSTGSPKPSGPAASGIALFAPRVVETGAHAKDGHGSARRLARVGVGLFGRGGQGPAGRGHSAAGADVALTGALHQGELSSAELQTDGGGRGGRPGECPDPRGAGRGRGVTPRAARHRLSAAGRGPEQRDRTHPPSTGPRAASLPLAPVPRGRGQGEFFCDEVAWARVAPRLEAEAKERWKAAGSSDPGTLEAHRLDAFLDILAERRRRGTGGAARTAPTAPDGAHRGGPGRDPGHHRRRGLAPGHDTRATRLCEIEGIGPVSVAAAIELLGEGALRFVVKEGFDIKTVTRSDRGIAKAVEAALDRAGPHLLCPGLWQAARART